MPLNFSNVTWKEIIVSTSSFRVWCFLNLDRHLWKQNIASTELINYLFIYSGTFFPINCIFFLSESDNSNTMKWIYSILWKNITVLWICNRKWRNFWRTFVRIFWKNNIQQAYLPKLNILGPNCLWDISPVMLRRLIQILLNFTWVIALWPESN